MTITAITGTMPARTQSQNDFDANMAQFVAALPAFQSQANALATTLNSIAAGTAMSIPYTFSTTTTDADPGAGILQLDNATQNLATVIRADLVGADGSTWTDVLNTFAASTNTVKGHIMLQKLADATKWILFSVSALASPAGYRNITVAVVAASAASPFINGDSLILKFTRAGDVGAPGAAGTSGFPVVATHTISTAVANIDFLSAFSSTYDNYLIIGHGITAAADDFLFFRLANGGVVDTGSNYFNDGGSGNVYNTASTSIPLGGAAFISAGRGGGFEIVLSNVNDATRLKTGKSICTNQSNTPNTFNTRRNGISYIGGAVSGCRFYWNSGSNFGATGVIRIYGYNNT